jgi:hypothetical protein
MRSVRTSCIRARVLPGNNSKVRIVTTGNNEEIVNHRSLLNQGRYGMLDEPHRNNQAGKKIPTVIIRPSHCKWGYPYNGRGLPTPGLGYVFRHTVGAPSSVVCCLLARSNMLHPGLDNVSLNTLIFILSGLPIFIKPMELSFRTYAGGEIIKIDNNDCNTHF